MMRVAPHRSVLVEGDVSLEVLHGLVSGTFSLLRDYRVIELLPDKLEQIVKIPVVVGYVTGVWAAVVVLLQLDRAVAVAAFVRPLDEVRIEDVSDLRRHQGAGEFLFKLVHLADDVFIAVACIQGLPEGTVG